jgi:hypothetical protein
MAAPRSDSHLQILAWLEIVGFELGQVFEVGVEERKLVIRAV